MYETVGALDALTELKAQKYMVLDVEVRYTWVSEKDA